MSDVGKPRMSRIAFSSVAGTALEYYDFAVYNTLAALVFNKLFFPTFDPRAGLLLSFATYWVGYLSRPLGGIVFGSLGDRRGRRFVLVVTLLMMGVTTTAIGCLPTYAQVGALAPALLVALRFLQGMALGGEWAGAVLLSMEHGDPQRRGRNAAWAQMGPSTGVLIATGTIALLTALLSPGEMEAWGWRVPLLASVVLVAFGLWMRLGVPETPEFRALERELGAGARTARRGVARALALAADRGRGAVRSGRSLLLHHGVPARVSHEGACAIAHRGNDRARDRRGVQRGVRAVRERDVGPVRTARRLRRGRGAGRGLAVGGVSNAGHEERARDCVRAREWPRDPRDHVRPAGRVHHRAVSRRACGTPARRWRTRSPGCSPAALRRSR